MHKSQILLVLLVAFLLGVAAGSFFTLSESHPLGLLILGLFVLVVSAYHRTFGATQAGIRKRRIGFTIGCAILVLAGGIWQFQRFEADHSRLTQFNDRLVAGKYLDVIVRGYVDGPIISRESNVQFPFRVKEIYIPGRKIPGDERILITTSIREPYRVGDVLMIQGAPRAPINTNDFDYIVYLKKQSIRTLMTTSDISADTQSLSLSFFERTTLFIKRSLAQLGQKFTHAIELSISEPHASYVNGILLGMRQNIPEDLREKFARTSTTHVLAISGFNIAIVMGAVMWLFLFVVYRRTAFWLAVGVIILFTLLTGASSSVVRAAIMGIIVLAGLGYGRLYDPKIALALAAAGMVFFNPFLLVFDVGFQLSFLAVVGLVYLYPVLERWARKVPKVKGLKELVLMTLAAQIATLPLILGYFHSLSLVSLPVNILILPLMPVVMLFGFLTGIAGMIWMPLGKLVGAITWALSEYQLTIVRWFGSRSFAAVNLELSWWLIALVYGGLAIVIYRQTKKYGNE